MVAVAVFAVVKAELSQVVVMSAVTRKAETSAFLRLCGSLQPVAGGVMIHVEIDLASTAKRVRAAIVEVFASRCELVKTGSPGRGGVRYVVRVFPGEALARQAGLLDWRGMPILGLPPDLVRGSAADLAAVWRGALLANGSLTGQGDSAVLGVSCPSPEVALALVGAARRLGCTASVRPLRGLERVVVRGEDRIAALLARLGAEVSVAYWRERNRARMAEATPGRGETVRGSNRLRAVEAAARVRARVHRALAILGDEVPEQFRYVAGLRLAYPNLSLIELGRMADPPLTKDTVAGRIRRLLEAADRAAMEAGSSEKESISGPAHSANERALS